MGVASSKEPKEVKPVDASKPVGATAEAPPKDVVVYDDKVPIKFEKELNSLDLMFGFSKFTDKENNSSNFYISCIRRDKDLVVIAIDGEMCFEKIVNCFEFEDLRKVLDVKIKRGSVSMVQIFRAFQRAVEKKKLVFTVDETQQNGKLAVELTINSVRTELGFRMKPLLEAPYERVCETFLHPLMEYYFDNFETSEGDELRIVQKECKKLEEQLAYLEYCKKVLSEEEEKKNSPPIVVVPPPINDISIVVEEPSLVISSSQISMSEPNMFPLNKKSHHPTIPSIKKLTPIVDISNMTVTDAISILQTTKKKLIKSRSISHLDVDAFNCVVRALSCGNKERKTTASGLEKDTLEIVKTAYKDRNKDQPRPSTPSWDPQINLKSSLMKMSSWEFDVFDIPEKPIVCVGFYIFLENDLFRKFQIPEQTLINFLNQVEVGYNNNPFHNSRRAVEVLQAVNFFIQNGGLNRVLSDESILAVLVSAIILDLNHPGFNNTFQMNTSSYLSTLYNNRSVLENHHLTGAFEILYADENNIFKGLTEDQYQDIRETIIQIVLATDMSSHSYTLNRFTTKLVGNIDSDFSSKDDSRLLLQMVVKVADISYTFRESNQYLKWASLLEEEFFVQGDHEKKLGFQPSVYGERSRSLLRVFQRTYLASITNPMLSAFIKALPELSFLQGYLQKNEAIWPPPSNNSSSFRLLPTERNIIEIVK